MTGVKDAVFVSNFALGRCSGYPKPRILKDIIPLKLSMMSVVSIADYALCFVRISRFTWRMVGNAHRTK
jgi:hypothetical protein